MKRMFIVIALSLASMAVCASPIMTIDANHMGYDLEKDQGVFEGNVQADIILTSVSGDSMVVDHEDEFTVSGDVTVHRDDLAFRGTELSGALSREQADLTSSSGEVRYEESSGLFSGKASKITITLGEVTEGAPDQMFSFKAENTALEADAGLTGQAPVAYYNEATHTFLLTSSPDSAVEVSFKDQWTLKVLTGSAIIEMVDPADTSTWVITAEGEVAFQILKPSGDYMRITQAAKVVLKGLDMPSIEADNANTHLPLKDPSDP